MVFNSVGSNYTWRQLPSSLNPFNFSAANKLKNQLTGTYGRNVILTYKAREAIYLSLKNLDLKQGSLIGVNGYTCYALYDAVVSAGFKPFYIDIAPNEVNFGPQQLKAAIADNNIKAVIVQNTLGTPCDIKNIASVCADADIDIIEDAAHSIGMKYNDSQEVGMLGFDTIFSFSQDKVIDSVAGGALITSSKRESTNQKVKVSRQLIDYHYVLNTLLIRTTYKLGLGKVLDKALRRFSLLSTPMYGAAKEVKTMTNWHSSLALKGLSDLENNIARRQSIASIYREGLPDRLQFKHFDESIYLRFPIKISDRDKLIEHLKSFDIHISDIWYDTVIGPERCFDKTDYVMGTCPESERVAKDMMNLPTHTNVSIEAAEKIVKEINKWITK